MIQLLIRFGKWLEKRFPTKAIVTVENLLELIQRIENLEKNSVHVDAVKAIVEKVKEIHDEFATVKTGLGLSSPKTSEILAMLNGHPIGVSEDSNG